ncbi:MAG: acyl-CoA dehydrogenase [Deltaproteobacteria bacterium]|nr:acyl-CoA dehydrogenase [Deltaproteobacteria bacterium]
MNSTQYSIDRRDIRFVQKEFLRVQELTRLEGLSQFTEEDFDLILQEGCNFAEEVLAPLNKTGDQDGSKLTDGKVKTPAGFKEAWQQFGEYGWLGITSPAEFGGQGLPLSVAVGVLEGFFGANPGLYLTPMLTTGSAGLIVRFGSDEQKAAYCEKMITGVWAGTMCLSEPNAGTAVGDITTSAEKAPDGDHYLIRGTKTWISGGDHDFTENIIHLVLARVKGAPAGPKGISLFIVPKFRLDANGDPGEFNGVTTVSLEHKLGIKSSPTAMLEFGGDTESHGFLLEGENLGMSQMFTLMNEARYVVAYQGLGAAAGAYRNALAYANERIQGIPIESGKDPSAQRTPILSHPDVRNMLMTMKALVEGTRGLIHALGYYTDMLHHGPESTRQHYRDLVDILTPVAKNAGADQGFEAIRLGIQVLGGVGYTEEFPLAQHLRDTKIASIYEGTSGIQALDLVTRKLNLRGGELYMSLLKEISDLDEAAARSQGLSAAIVEWKSSLELLKATVAALGETMKTQGAREAVFNASDVTVMFGDVMCAYYLLKMALVAQDALEKLTGGQDAALKALESEETAFYYNKIKTAEHYVFQILPRIKGIEFKVRSGNYAALEAVLTTG